MKKTFVFLACVLALGTLKLHAEQPTVSIHMEGGVAIRTGLWGATSYIGFSRVNGDYDAALNTVIVDCSGGGATKCRVKLNGHYYGGGFVIAGGNNFDSDVLATAVDELLDISEQEFINDGKTTGSASKKLSVFSNTDGQYHILAITAVRLLNNSGNGRIDIYINEVTL